MITVTSILGSASNSKIANLLHDLEHRNSVEFLVVDHKDILRRRLRGKTDKGTEIAIALERNEQLSNGAVLLLDDQHAIVVRMPDEHWLRITPCDADAALEAGYCAGNHHWRVKFEPGALLIAMEGPAEHYTTRLDHLLKARRIEVVAHE